MRRFPFLSRQRGVAVVTALLLTTLAITIVGSLFWQQQVQVRSIENQRLQLQKQWILRGALDWTRLILREDARHSRTDHLGEPWAVSLAETRLDQYVDNARAETEVPDAALSGDIVDAQSRFNLTNLAGNGVINPAEVAAFGRLLTQLQLNASLAQATASLMASTQTRVVQQKQQAQQKQQQGGTSSPPAGETGATAAPATSTATQLTIMHVDDLLAVPGFTPEALARLKDFVVVLPRATPVNVNTASAEVLAAKIENLSLPDATALVRARESAWFKDTNDFAQRLPGQSLPSGTGQIAVSTGYFLVNGHVRLERAGLDIQALIERSGPSTRVVWIRES